MKLRDLHQTALTESILLEDPFYQEGYNVGKLLIEYAMTPAQIQQAFAQAEEEMTAGGKNRTALGKTADVASVINKGWEKVKTAIQNTKPVDGFDQKFENLKDKIMQSAGGEENKINQAIQTYRAFAKKHPIMQNAVYSGMLILAGISGAGLPGAALLGGIKLFDRVLQGDKASSAIYSAFKTGAGAYLAGKLFGKGAVDTPPSGGGKVFRGATSDTSSFSTVDNTPGISPDAKGDTLKAMGNTDVTPGLTASNVPTEIRGNKELTNAYKSLVDKIQSNPDYNVRNLPNDIANRLGLDQKQSSILSLAVQKAGGGSMQGFLDTIKGAAVKESAFIDYGMSNLNESLSVREIYFNEEGIRATFFLVQEGIWDTVKGAAGKAAGAVAQKAAQVGSNLTNKVTASKLNKAWQAANGKGSADSEAVKDFLVKQGVDATIAANAVKAVAGTATAKSAVAPAASAAKPAQAPAPKAAAPAAKPAMGADQRAAAKAKQQAWQAQQRRMGKLK